MDRCPHCDARKFKGGFTLIDGFLYWSGGTLKLKNRESDVLEALMTANGRTLHPSYLIDYIYSPRGFQPADEKIVNVFVCQLRKRLRENNVPLRINNRWGRGYWLEVVGEAHQHEVCADPEIHALQPSLGS